ncbi:hypothetical protein HBI55_105360 [Parastagonospora nodorum]|nr:hypothetical protein HBI47_112490 [Parastagonospora nodorum]KAH5773256.1 hypothetical protein HBI16_105450 [Parastagonospora nodorum]KAH6096672.1 hypothetical protein HBI65_095740 [Parastagonospora nodorum]KAH6495258.1 hypothetical protein HBI55_105360 [Parastagonospora nodorum]
MECIWYFLRESSAFCSRVMKACCAVFSFSAASATSVGSWTSHVNFLLLSRGPWYRLLVEQSVPSGARCFSPSVWLVPLRPSVTAIVVRSRPRLSWLDGTSRVENELKMNQCLSWLPCYRSRTHA